MFLFVVLAALCFGQASDVTGKWIYSMDTPNGPMPVTLDLKVEGSQLTGTVAAADRLLKIEKGSVEGGVVKFSVKRERPDGGAMVYEMTGKVEGSVMKGSTTADMGGEKVTQDWEAKKQ